ERDVDVSQWPFETEADRGVRTRDCINTGLISQATRSGNGTIAEVRRPFNTHARAFAGKLKRRKTGDTIGHGEGQLGRARVELPSPHNLRSEFFNVRSIDLSAQFVSLGQQVFERMGV